MGVIIGLFKEITIYSSIHAIIKRVKAPVTLLIHPIAKKNTLTYPWFEFYSSLS